MHALLAGAAIGFVGSLHCIGMCGGIAAALSTAGPAARNVSRSALPRTLAYNGGRVASYTLAGALAGGFGAALASLGGANGMLVLRGFAALLIVATGLYVAGWSTAVSHIEKLGLRVWTRVAPLAGGLRPRESLLAAFGLGALWGWLPCGLVYSALAVAAASGSPASGAVVMLGFGAATLPAVLSVGLAAGRGVGLLRGASARRLAGAAIIVFGLWTFAAASGAAERMAAHGGGDAGEVPSCHQADGEGKGEGVQ